MSKLIWGLRITATVILAIIGFIIWTIGGIFYADDQHNYKVTNPDKNVLKAVETELGVELPADMRISSISTTTPFFDDDSYINIDILSNYSENQWRELLASSTRNDPEYQRRRQYMFDKMPFFYSKNARNRMTIIVVCNQTNLYSVLVRNGVENDGNAILINLLRAIGLIIIAALPVLPYEKVYYRIKLGYWS